LKIRISHYPRTLPAPFPSIKMKGTLLEENVPFRLYLGFHWSNFPENLYLALLVQFGCDSSLIRHTLLEEQCGLSSASVLKWEEFSWKLIPRNFHKSSTNCATFVTVDQKWKLLCLQLNSPTRLYLDFYWWDFLENLCVALPTRTL
jgi:hypothetical protein